MRKKSVPALERFRPEKMTKVNLFETQRFFCDLYCLLPGQEQKVHAHAANDKLYYALRGALQVTVGAETAPLEAGEIVMAAAGEPHGIRNASSAEAVCMVFMAPHPGWGKE